MDAAALAAGEDVMTLIKDQEHMATSREDGQIVKRPKTILGVAQLANEMLMLTQMEPSGCVPKIISYMGSGGAANGEIILEDLGDGEEVTNTDELLTHAIYLLAWLNKSRIFHGDLTAPNIIIRDNKPYAIDFSESLDLDEMPMPKAKRPEADWFHLLQAMEAHGDPRRIIRRWLAIRESLGAASLEGKSLMDFGCHEGFMSALAAAEGVSAIGWEQDKKALVSARNRWRDFPHAPGQFPLLFVDLDIEEFGSRSFPTGYEIGLCLSVYPYLIQQLGEEHARLTLAKMVAHFDVLFFEAQSAGDGPGPAFWPDQNAVGEYLTVFGKVEEVCRLEIDGREAERVTWKVTK